jgi:hypothetical protein
MSNARAKSATGFVRSITAIAAGVMLAAGCATMSGSAGQASVPVMSQQQLASRPFVKVNEVQSTPSCSQKGDDVTFEGMQALQVEAAKVKADALTNVSCGEGTPTDSCTKTYVCKGDAIRFDQNVAGNVGASSTVGG